MSGAALAESKMVAEPKSISLRWKFSSRTKFSAWIILKLPWCLNVRCLLIEDKPIFQSLEHYKTSQFHHVIGRDNLFRGQNWWISSKFLLFLAKVSDSDIFHVNFPFIQSQQEKLSLGVLGSWEFLAILSILFPTYYSSCFICQEKRLLRYRGCHLRFLLFLCYLYFELGFHSICLPQILLSTLFFVLVFDFFIHLQNFNDSR